MGFLEQSIAELEIKISQRGNVETLSPVPAASFDSGHFHGTPDDIMSLATSTTYAASNADGPVALVQSLLENTADARNVLFEQQALHGHSVLPYSDIIFSESHLPAPLCRPKSGDELSLRANIRKRSLDTPPASVARTLLNTYIERILPQYPIFHETELEQTFDSVYASRGGPISTPACDSMIMYLIMAITTMTSKSTDTHRTLSLAESLHAEALTYCSALATSSLRSLQCLFLLVQTAILLPHTGDLVHLVNETTRMVAELGLHQEHTLTPEATKSEINMRRKIFWSVRDRFLEALLVSVH